jgi:hypothetical protein
MLAQYIKTHVDTNAVKRGLLYMLQESKVTEILNKLIYNKYIIELS